MRITLLRSLLVTAALFTGLLTTAQGQEQNRRNFSPWECRELRSDRLQVREDRREIGGDRRERRQDRRELRSDVREFRNDRREGASRLELRADRREMKRIDANCATITASCDGIVGTCAETGETSDATCVMPVEAKREQPVGLSESQVA